MTYKRVGRGGEEEGGEYTTVILAPIIDVFCHSGTTGWQTSRTDTAHTHLCTHLYGELKGKVVVLGGVAEVVVVVIVAAV